MTSLSREIDVRRREKYVSIIFYLITSNTPIRTHENLTESSDVRTPPEHEAFNYTERYLRTHGAREAGRTGVENLPLCWDSSK